MDITPLIPTGSQVINTYGDYRFRISGIAHEGAVLVLPMQVVPWEITDFASLTMASLEPVLTADPAVELLILGCGPRMEMVPGPLRRELRAKGLIIEPMDTGAACRTYNVLLLEGRRVAAALLPVE